MPFIKLRASIYKLECNMKVSCKKKFLHTNVVGVEIANV